MKNISRRFVRQWALLLLAISLSAASTCPAATLPTISFTNLKTGQKLSNDVFTVVGKASATAGVSNVLYALNTNAWASPDPGNRWTNWSAQLTLIPGTNKLSAYAVDNSGNRSLTNTVRFVYVVTDVLTVRTNGTGYIRPAYNGVALQIGVGYSMTASSVKSGYGLRTWTDGNSNVLSTAGTLNFTMASNLTIIANFGDTAAPTIRVVSTTTNSDGVASHFIVHGTAADNIAVTNVIYQLNAGYWQTAATTNHWTNWTASVTLYPGANTFNAYAMDSSSNYSQILTAQITYNGAPKKISGQSAVGTDLNGNSLFTVGFGTSTFSLAATDPGYSGGVGAYTYIPSGGFGSLNFKYTAPPGSAKKGSRNLNLGFYTPNYAYFSTTNVVATNRPVYVTNNLVVSTNWISTNVVVVNSGYLTFTTSTNIALSNLVSQVVWSVDSTGGGNGRLFQKTNYTALVLLSSDTNSGNYTYAPYSPVGSLIKLTDASGTNYVVATFTDTNYGAYYSESYPRSGPTNTTDTGHFFVASQTPGGNAPLALTNRNLHIFAVDGDFKVQFGPDTYSQTSATTNYDTDVGNYSYDRSDTNIGQLNLTVTAPPAVDASNVLAGTTSATRLIFAGPNVGLFTNNDATVSTFVMSSATNFAPATIVSNTISFSILSNIRFAGDGSFNYFNFPFSYPGTYTYTPVSPGVGMVQLSYVTSNSVTGLDWLQLNFKATNSGTVFWNQFNAQTNFIDNYRGSFSLY